MLGLVDEDISKSEYRLAFLLKRKIRYIYKAINKDILLDEFF